MDMKAITGSSQIIAIGYDPVTRTLQIRFTNGSEYQYGGVPTDLYEKLMASESKGQFLHRHIKGKFQFTKVKEPTPKE